MTPSERAEKIMVVVKRNCEECDYSHWDPLEEIAAEIRAAVEEALDRPGLDQLADSMKYKQRIRASALEEAAKTSENCAQTCDEDYEYSPKEIAAKIRALKDAK